MIGNLYDMLYRISFLDYEVWVFGKNGKVVMYGKPNEIYRVIGSYFKLVNVNDCITDEVVQYVYLHTDL